MDEGWTSWNSWKNWKIPWKMMGLPWKNIVDLRIGLNIDRQNWDERNISQRDSTKMMDISLKRVSSGAGILGMFFCGSTMMNELAMFFSG